MPRKQTTTAASSVWDSLGYPAAEVAHLHARAALMDHIVNVIASEGLTQSAVASRCHVSQPRINDLMRGRISRFSLDALVDIAAALGSRVTLEFQRSGAGCAADPPQSP